eukprot:1039468-Amphidinium_carterae.1
MLARQSGDGSRLGLNHSKTLGLDLHYGSFSAAHSENLLIFTPFVGEYWFEGCGIASKDLLKIQTDMRSCKTVLRVEVRTHKGKENEWGLFVEMARFRFFCLIEFPHNIPRSSNNSNSNNSSNINNNSHHKARFKVANAKMDATDFELFNPHSIVATSDECIVLWDAVSSFCVKQGRNHAQNPFPSPPS